MGPGEQFQRRLEYPGDSTYTAMEKTASQQGARVSRKRKLGKKMTTAEKEYGKALAKIRIRVEHATRRVKAFMVIGDRCRNPRRKYAIINDIACGLASMVRLWERVET